MNPTKDVKGVKDVKTSRGSGRVGVVLFVLFTSLSLFTSLPSAEQSQAPVFRGKVEIVQLDVSVLDKHRQPVRGLTERDFTILEDGKPQKIVGFSTFDTDDAPPPAAGWMRDVPPDVTTNDLKAESRLFVIVMDDAMIPQDPWMIQASKKIALSIIDKLGPDDLTAVIFTGDNRKTQDFTKDKTKLLAALDKFNPGLAGYRFGADSQGLDTDMHFFMSSVRTLSSVADYLIAIPNRRKSLFWISPGVPFDLEDMSPREAPRPGSAEQAQMAAVIDMRDLAERTQEIFKRAQLANVTIYPVDPTGLGGMDAFIRLRMRTPGGSVRLVVKSDPSQPNWETALTSFTIRKTNALHDFLAEAAAQTGGRTVMNINEFEPGITEIFEENKSYYYIAFEPTNAKEDGTLRKIQVKVNRPDVDVRTRSSYYAPEPEKPNKKLAAMTPETAALAKSMSGILPLAGMPLKASVAAFAVPGQRLSTVAVVLGVRQPVPTAASNGRITETTELLTSAFTPEGDARGSQRHTAKVVLRAGANGDAEYEVLARIDLPAGRYQLRLATHNSTAGKDGSVFVDVTVPDYSNVSFSATPVVLGASPGRVSAPKDLFTPLLPLVPTAEREFATTAKVTAFMRLYQSGQKPVDKVQLAIRVRDAQDQLKVDETKTIGVDQFPAIGQQLVTNSLAEPPLPIRRPPGGTPAQAPKDSFANLSLRTADVAYQIPMSKLSAGPHLLTFEATLGTTTIRRDVRFDVK
jgi:VWFA-related protein